MNTFQFALEHSPWFIPLCLAIGATYAYLLYSKKFSWSKNTNRFLFGLRFILVSIICLLFLEPILHQFINEKEKPIVALAIDNSVSITLNSSKEEREKALTSLKNLSEQLESRGFDVQIEQNKNTSSDSIDFNIPYTNLTDLLLSIQEKYEAQNLASVILFSDGMYNKGGSPLFRDYLFNIHTIGFGDTTEQKDIALKALLHNKLTYPNTIFPIQAEIKNSGFAGQSTTVQLIEDGEIIEQKNITFSKEKGLTSIEFNTSSTEPGLHKYTVRVSAKNGEYTTKNNIQTAYIDIIDGSQNILIAAMAPHPDIKAIKLALKEKINIKVDLFIPGTTLLDEKKKYDLVIFHQIPNMKGAGQSLLNEYLKNNTPLLFILGNQSNIKAFNSQNNCLSIVERGKKDEVSLDINDNFTRFNLHEDLNTLEKAPPLSVPYGETSLKPGSEILFFQKIGNSSNGLPLIAFNIESTKKTGVVLGEGIWQWRLFEYRQNNSQEAFDDLINNIIQLLATKADNRKFLVQTTSRQYDEEESVTFISEVYNDVLENIYGQEIALQIKAKDSRQSFNYSFTNNKYQNKYELKQLPPGIYNYTASTLVGDKKMSYSGEFVIKKSDMEALSSKADHNLLKTLSRETGGQFVLANNIDQLNNVITKENYKDKIHTTENRLPIIHLKWIFFLLMGLATLEWGARKYLGSY